jgi:tetratricopeptide (TPR) repeat protein/predicted Ser/Thr protein kinase
MDQNPEPPPPEKPNGSRSEDLPSAESDLIAVARRDAERLIRRGAEPFHQRSAPPPSDAIPGYVLEREIHRGGQGVVYLALRQSTGRRVAIKVLRDGPFADAREVLRFEREMQVLSRLEHPNIVRILDRGIAHGQHWFAMDYIDGPSLDRWLSDGERSRADVLRVFQRICAAVQAAHLQGVVHRDLKPSNIRLDSSGEPHVLDFGLARSGGDAHLLDRTVAGEFVGTPAWTSPEQLARDPSRIDQRTDVYLLGLILFKLLTGRSPGELSRHREEMIAALKVAAPAPSSVRRGIDGELDTIVGTCLAPEQDRRYQSVHALAQDIEHYLRGEPIDARRDSRWYLLRVFVRRYRGPLAAVLLTGSAVTALSALSTTQWIRAERAAASERRAWREAEEEREARASSEAAAQRNAAMFEAASELFIDDVLDASDPLEGDEEMRIAEVLARGADRIGERFTDPRIQAQFHARFGRTFKSLRQWDSAIEHLTLALGRLPPEPSVDEERATLLEDLGFALVRSGKAKQSLEVQREALALRKSLQPQPSLQAAKSLLGVASAQAGLGALEEAIAADREALSMLSGPALHVASDHPTPIELERARAQANLALHLRRLAERRMDAQQRAELLAESAALSQEVVATFERHPLRGPEHPVTLQARNNLAMCLRERGQTDAAIGEWQRAIQGWRSRQPSDQPLPLSAATPLYNLAATYAYRVAAPAQALELADEVLQIRRTLLRPDHVEVARALSLLAFCVAESGGAAGPAGGPGPLLSTAQAVALLEQCRSIHAQQPGGRIPALVSALQARCLLRFTDPSRDPAGHRTQLAALTAAVKELERDLPEGDRLRSTVSRWLAEVEPPESP